MFCLETVKPNEAVFNPIGCNCKYIAHGSCLQTWFEQKSQYECPICHSVSIPNPIQPQPMYQIVYIQQHPTESQRILRRNNRKCAMYGCVALISMGIVMNILEAVLRR